MTKNEFLIGFYKKKKYIYIFKSQLPQGIGMEAVVGVGQYVVATVGGFGAFVAEVPRSDFAFSGSSSCEVAA